MPSIPEGSLVAAVPDAVVREPQAKTSEASGFSQVVVQLLQDANADQLGAESQARELAEGRGDVLETMIAINRADLSLRLTVQLRNRALEAYQELMRIQV